LAEALDSIYSQTRPVDEVVYLDDGSGDNSVTIAERYVARGLILLRNLSSQGIPAARNRAASACQNTWIAVLDADDRWREDKNALQLAYLERHPHVGLLGSYAYVLGDGSQRLGVITTPTVDAEIKHRELISNCFVHSSVVFRRDIFQRVGGYSDLAAAQDYDLMLKLSEHVQVANLSEPLVDHRIGIGSVTVRKRRTQRACTQAARQNAYRRRAKTPRLRDRTEIILHRVYSFIVLFDPQVHWGLHQLCLGNAAAGRSLLRRARSGSLRSFVTASLSLLIPNAVYRVVARIRAAR
jgi:glycosyltransferase involved in cell wall biosynthesis